MSLINPQNTSKTVNLTKKLTNTNVGKLFMGSFYAGGSDTMKMCHKTFQNRLYDFKSHRFLLMLLILTKKLWI